MTVEDFRQAFPQFTVDLFPDSRVQFYLVFAAKSMNAPRWGELLPEGTALFVAHYLTLEAAATKAADGTGGMDAAAGAVISTTKSVGQVSKSESRAGSGATASANPLAGHWNETIYGKQYFDLARLIGVGGVVV